MEPEPTVIHLIDQWAREAPRDGTDGSSALSDVQARTLLGTLLEGSAVDVDDVWERVEDALAATTVGESLQVRPGGWTLDLRRSAARTALAAAVIGGLMAPAGLDQLPAYVLPAVIPLLVEVSAARLTRADRRLVLEVRLSQTAQQLDRPWPPGAFYSRLPAHVQARVSFEDFEDFLDALVKAGEADRDAQDEITLRPSGDAAWFRLTLE